MPSRPHSTFTHTQRWKHVHVHMLLDPASVPIPKECVVTACRIVHDFLGLAGCQCLCCSSLFPPSSRSFIVASVGARELMRLRRWTFEDLLGGGSLTGNCSGLLQAGVVRDSDGELGVSCARFLFQFNLILFHLLSHFWTKRSSAGLCRSNQQVLGQQTIAGITAAVLST